MNKTGASIANAKAGLGVAAANAASTGGDVLANAVNGTKAKANALTACGGDAQVHYTFHHNSNCQTFSKI